MLQSILIYQFAPILSQYGFDISSASVSEIVDVLPAVYKYISTSNASTFLPLKAVLPSIKPFLRPTINNVCYPSYGCFDNSNDFECLSEAVPADPKDATFHLRAYDQRSYTVIPVEAEPQEIDTFLEGASKIILHIHGWRSGGSHDAIKLTKLANNRFGGKAKMIALDWRKESGDLNYLRAAQNGRLVARAVTKFLKTCLENGFVTAANIHLIGHSLGAHVAGFIGSELAHKGHKIGRITGLDPAGPFFDKCTGDSRLDASDADFVDVIHTNPGVLPDKGIDVSTGHVDYYFEPPEWCNHHCSHHLATSVFMMADDKNYWDSKCKQLVQYTGFDSAHITNNLEQRFSYKNLEHCFFQNFLSSDIRQKMT